MFKPRRQRVYGRHSLGSVRTKRQETLTQIGFVNATPLTDKEIDDEMEMEAYEREEKARRKRRKTTTPLRAKRFTQTLTQMPFASTSRTECRDSEGGEEEEEQDEAGQDGHNEQAEEQEAPQQPDEPHVPKKRKSRRRGVITVRCIKVEPELSPSKSRPQSPELDDDTVVIHDSFGNTAASTQTGDAVLMPPPKTPTRKRILEVPSSQSPSTPLSTQSVSRTPRTHDERSPLKYRSHNIVSPSLPCLAKASGLGQSQVSTQGITQYSDEIAIVPDSSPMRRPDRSRRATTSSQSPSKQVLLEFGAASSSKAPPSSAAPRTILKDEIADSDADSDDELETQEPAQMPPSNIQVPNSPDAMPPLSLLGSSPLRRPLLMAMDTQVDGLDVGETRTQWTRSQLLPDSIMEDSLLPVPPVLEDSDWEG
jgi:hypothetical protein